ncbi:MAG: HAMP domain-containing sensor histidine kinase, partial [Pseudomonadota bacterium]|nr:HAMP domain-containing sensor histidine kinase [Pseudomonadota bacterium]
EQMLTMVDALLGLVRYEKSQTNAPLRTIEANEILNIVQKNQAQADAKKLQLRSDIHGSPMTQATPAILEMVLGNLLRNSIAASSSGDITVSMTDTSITVTDEGEGYAPSENSTGHGLGLLIVQDLCQRYGWGFSIRNRMEGGCEATLRLPVITLE